MRRRTLLAAGGAAVPLGVAAASPADASPAHASRRRSWAHTWTAMPQLTEPHNLPPAPFAALADTTLRQTVHVTIGGRQLRVRFSNAFGTAPLPITAASVALPLGGRAGVAAIEPGSARPLTFGGRPSVVVPVGAQIVSDPVTLPVGAAANLTISAYLATGLTGDAVTGHPGSRTTSYLLKGDHNADPDLPGAVATDHWYLISAVEVLASTAALAIVGDSLTDGRGSTTNGNDRWPDQLFARGSKVAVLNQAAGGNRVLNDGLGPNVLARLDRDVLAVGNADRMLLFEGVNDIGTAEATEQAQKQVVDDLLVAFDQIVLRAHAAGLTVYGATLTPFGGNTGYDDPAGLRRRSRRAVNEAVHHIFDGVADFDAASRDPAAPETLLPAYDTGDHLHLNPAGYAALARAVPWTLIR
ncbi:SGNH/GDSL hydrolase family protein [Actinoplanes sp. CA-131856]